MLSEVPKNNEILRKNARKSKIKKNNNIWRVYDLNGRNNSQLLKGFLIAMPGGTTSFYQKKNNILFEKVDFFAQSHKFLIKYS